MHSVLCLRKCIPACVFVSADRDHRYHFPDAWDLEIWNVTRRDAGVYTVECSNAEGKNKTDIKLDVHCKKLRTSVRTTVHFKCYICVWENL